MYTSLTTTTPTVSPVSVSYFKQHARITNNFDDSLVASYLMVATDMVEAYLSRYLFTHTATWTAGDNLHQGAHAINLLPWQWATKPILELPRPITSVTSVVLGLWGLDDVTLTEGTDFNLDLSTSLGRLQWTSNRIQNSNRSHLKVEFTSGFGDNTADIPQPICHAIVVLATSIYTRRGDDVPEIWTAAVENLLAPYRYTYFG